MELSPLSSEAVAGLLDNAAVPEHSVAFMRVMSGGTPFVEQGFLFIAADDWLMGIGYPFNGSMAEPAPGKSPSHAFEQALGAALERTGAEQCWAVAPELPERLVPFVDNNDVFYILDADSPVPARLRGPLAKTSGRLTLTEDREFTAAHRGLWSEFLGRVSMRPNVRGLYARTEAVLAASRAEALAPGPLFLDLRMLSAWDEQGNLAAALLLDYSPRDFCAYIIGAHSCETPAPHATDCLFASMLERCRMEGKKYIHLGLGVNEGITRFKRKWGGLPGAPYRMAAWKETPRAIRSGSGKKEIRSAVECLLSAPPGLSKQQVFNTFPEQRTFAMIREVRKGDAVSYLCGSAHFFRYSFEMAFRDLFEPLDNIIFEGPLDEDFLAAVEKTGRNPSPGAALASDTLSETEISRLERVVYGPEGPLPRFLGMQQPRRVDVRHLLGKTRPWFAFFSLWVAFLERHGWHQSVDLEAWRTAKDMGKPVIGMENLEEQIDSLEVIPPRRITDFLCRCDAWPTYMKRNIKAYLDGDLERMMGTSIEFPSRTEQVIDRRDERFRQRMRPFLEAGNCAVFVGTAHLVGLTPMLQADGFTVRPAYPGLRLKLKSRLRQLLG